MFNNLQKTSRELMTIKQDTTIFTSETIRISTSFKDSLLEMLDWIIKYK